MSGTASPVTPAARSPPHRFAGIDRSPSPRHARVANLATGGFHSFDTTEELGPAVPHRIPSLTTVNPTTVFGFSPPSTHSAVLTGTSPVAPNMMFPKAGVARPVLSPQVSSPQVSSPTEPFFFPHNNGEFPGIIASSPRALPSELHNGSRSRRNSAAVVSISLSSRSRSRTPRGSTSVLPTRSGSGPQSKVSTPKGDASAGGFNGTATSSLADAWAPGVDDMDDWQPTGGVLLDADESTTGDSFSFDDDYQGRSWTAESEASHVADVLRPGMIFGEGLEFEGGIIEPAVGRLYDTPDVDLPLRRDGSQIGTARGSQPGRPRTKKTYEVIRQLGSGSYAVVYLVRERGGRKREFALKCLAKHDLEEEQLETQLFEATIHLSLPIHRNIVTLHETLQTKNWLFLMLELCPGEDLFYWLERSRDASPPPVTTRLPAVLGHEGRDREGMQIMSSSRLSSSSIPFSSSQLFSNFPSSYSNSPGAFGSSYNASPASLLFAHHNGSFATSHMSGGSHGATPPTPSLLSAFSANTLLTPRRLRLIASMFSQMCEAVAICHNAGVSHRDIKPENFICCDSVELESVAESNSGDDDESERPDFGPQAKRKVIVKLTDFGLATTDVESGDVECGSKPYMSFECRNNLGPTYCPRPADVWSLGIVLINMLFHRNPWKDPTEGDPNFDAFLQDPVTFLQTKFTGIGKEVATYLANHVLCINVDDRVTASQLGQWIRSLPEMIAGRRAVRDLKKTRLESRAKQTAGDKGLFVKSPVGQVNPGRSSLFTSALTSSAPVAAASVPSAAMSALDMSDEPEYTPSLATLPPASELSQGSTMSSQATSFANPAPTPDLDREEIRSATTIDDHPTPTDMSTVVSPEPTENGQDDIIMEEPEDAILDEPVAKSNTHVHHQSLDKSVDEASDKADDKSVDGDRSISNQKRRKRGVRKGKAAQAAAAAAASGAFQEERDALISELVQASEHLARDLSTKKRFDPTREEDFPPLGTSPAEMAAARKSKWKDFLAMSKSNPQLEALAKRVAERDSDAGGTWSAPAKLQQGTNNHRSRHAHLKHTATTMSSSGFSHLTSIPASESSASSSFIGGPDDDDWRRAARQREEERRAREQDRRERDKDGKDSASATAKRPSSRRGTEDSSSSRSRQAAAAAAAIAGGLEPMGAFGKPSHLGRPVPLNHRPPGSYHRPSALSLASPAEKSSPTVVSSSRPDKKKSDTPKSHTDSSTPVPPSIKTTISQSPNDSAHNLLSATSATSTSSNASPLQQQDSPSKPKIKGQIHGLAKMFGGLKTKGRD